MSESLDTRVNGVQIMCACHDRLIHLQILLTNKLESYNISQISGIDTIFSKHSRAVAFTNGSLSLSKVLKTLIGMFFSSSRLMKKCPIQKKKKEM